jgi:branched-chain amino acid transport system substrate-binding protein
MRLTELMRVHPRRAAALTILGLALSAGLAGCQRTPEVVKIGVGQPLSGNIASWGQDMLDGATLAVEEINAAGGVRIGDKHVRLEIVSADDKADPETGKVVAKKLVDAGVLVAIANLNSGVSIPAAPIYAEAGIAQMAISTKPSYTQLNLPTTLRLVANDDLQARALAQHAAQMEGADRFAVIDDNTPYGKGLADATAAAIAKGGKQVTLRKSMDNQTTEFKSLMPELSSTSTHVIVTTLSDFQVEALAKQLAAANLSGMRILGGDGLKTDNLLRAGGLVRGIYATSPIIDAREFRNGQEYISKFRQRFKKEPVYGGHYAYDAVYLVADALGRNGSADKAELLKRLKTFDGNAPITGSMRFKEDGEQRYGAVGVYELRGNEWRLLIRSDRW